MSELEQRKIQWRVLLEKWSQADERAKSAILSLVRETAKSCDEWPIQNFQFDHGDTPASFLVRNFKEVMRLSPIAVWEDLLSIIPGDLPVSALDSKNIKSLSNIWRRLLGQDSAAAREAAEVELGDYFCSLLGWSLIRRKQLSNLPFLEARVESTRIRLPHVVAVRFSYREDGNSLADLAADIERVSARIESSRQSSSGVVVNIIILDHVQAREVQRALAPEHSILLIGERELRSILLSRRQIDKFEEIAVKYLGLIRMNPYVWNKPVERPEMFFGREAEVDDVFAVPATDFIVIGSRRIGKSSLLRHLDRLASSNERTAIYIDCSVFRSEHEIIVSLTERINSRRSKRITLSTFGQMVRATYSVLPKNHRFLFLFDEVDRLVMTAEQSSNWQFFEVMRDLSNRGHVQCVFSGHKILVSSWRSQKSPLFNFVRPLYLSTLSREGAKKLVQIPMRSMNLEYETPAIVDEIILETGGHPSFIQALCGLIIKAIDRKPDSRRGKIDQLLLQEARSSRDYRELVLKTFSNEENLSKLDQLIVLELTKSVQPSFEIEILLHALSARCEKLGYSASQVLSADSIARSLIDLEVAGIVIRRDEKGKGEYLWTVSAFPEFLGRSLPVDRKIEELVRALSNGH